MSLKDRLSGLLKHKELSERDILMYDYFKQLPNEQININTTSFAIRNNNASNDALQDLYNSFLAVHVKLKKEDGTTDTTTEVASFSPSGWSLFKNVRFSINSQEIERTLKPAVVHNLKSKSSKGITKLLSQGPEEMYYPNSIALYAGGSVTAGGDDEWFLNGASKLTKDAGTRANGCWMKLYLRDVIGLIDNPSYVPPCNISLQLDKETHYENVVMKNGGADVTVQILDLQWWIPQLKLKQTSPLYEQYIVKQQKTYAMDYYQFGLIDQPIDIKTGVNNVTLFTNAPKTDHMFVAFAPASAYADQDGCKSIYTDEAGLTSLYCQYNGLIYPFNAYTPASDGYSRCVDMLEKAYGKLTSLDGSILPNMDNFKDYNAIYYFNLEANNSELDNNSLSQQISLTFSATTAKAGCSLHVWYLSPRSLDLVVNGSAVNVVALK